MGVSLIHLLMRSPLSDSSMRLFDCRMLKRPLHWWNNQLPTPGNPQHVSCLFSPDNSLIVTAAGQWLHFYSRRTFALVDRVQVTLDDPKDIITCIAWNRAINQIVCGTSNGPVSVLYDPVLSTKGALLCVARPSKRAAHEQSADWEPGMGQIINPLEEHEERKKRQKVSEPQSRLRPRLTVGATPGHPHSQAALGCRAPRSPAQEWRQCGWPHGHHCPTRAAQGCAERARAASAYMLTPFFPLAETAQA